MIKRAITLSMIILFTAASLFAEQYMNQNLVWEGTMPEVPFSFSLHYDGVTFSDLENYQNEIVIEGFSLNQDDETMPFQIYTNEDANTILATTVKTTVTANEFIGKASTSSEGFYSGITPDLLVITGGLQSDAYTSTDNVATFTKAFDSGQQSQSYTLANFELIWEGDQSVIAGEYQSIVDIEFESI